MRFRAVEWRGGPEGCLRIIDQVLLPRQVQFVDCRAAEDVWQAIKLLRVRGAPAIGIAAAMGAFLGVRDINPSDTAGLVAELRHTADYLASSRPTAVNLFWALERMVRVAEENHSLEVPDLKVRLLEEACTIRDEDEKMCRAIGEHGAGILADGDGVLTHCNAGALATAAYGTALASIFIAHERGMRLHVFADETRPLLQGARLTTWELMQAGIAVTLITDSTAGQVMKEGRVQLVLVGADRITANGDAANKIGTYSVAVLAQAHGIPFYVAAPSSTFDLSLPDGALIPIEERAAEEITEGFGRRTAPENVVVYNPAFDVTPANLITAIITEHGIIEQPDTDKIARHLAP
jgi:methylthioribose-1-phosphate isomerase